MRIDLSNFYLQIFPPLFLTLNVLLVVYLLIIKKFEAEATVLINASAENFFLAKLCLAPSVWFIYLPNCIQVATLITSSTLST